MIKNIVEFIYENNLTCNEAGNVYVKPTEGGGVQFFPLGNLEDCILITQEQLKGILNNTLKYDLATDSFKEVKDYSKDFLRIDQLKEKLSSTDYQAIKFMEGVLSEEEYAPIRAQRQEWRAEINRLEEVVKNA